WCATFASVSRQPAAQSWRVRTRGPARRPCRCSPRRRGGGWASCGAGSVAGFLAQSEQKLAVAVGTSDGRVERAEEPRAGEQHAVGESAGRSADIEHVRAVQIEGEFFQRGRQFLAAAADEARRLLD